MNILNKKFLISNISDYSLFLNMPKYCQLQIKHFQLATVKNNFCSERKNKVNKKSIYSNSKNYEQNITKSTNIEYEKMSEVDYFKDVNLNQAKDVLSHFDKKTNPSSKKQNEFSNEEDLELSLKDSFSPKKTRTLSLSQLINKLFNLYKHITDYETAHSSQKTDYNFYYFKVKSKSEVSLKRRVREGFSSNEVADSISLIIQKINNLKPIELCKFINLLVKIEYSNFDKWKKILAYYQTQLSLNTPTYQHVPIIDIVKIFTSLRTIYNFLPYTADQEVQTLLETSIKQSIHHLLNKFHMIDSRLLGSTFNSMSKLGLLDESMLLKIENDLIKLTKDDLLKDEDFIAIVFAILKSNCASEKLYAVLEKKCEILMNFYSQRPLAVDPVNVKMIIKSFYYASKYDDKKSKVFQMAESIFVNNTDCFPLHEAIELAFCLSKISEPSPVFYRKLDESLTKSKSKNLTEYLATFLIKLILSPFAGEFSYANIVEYVGLYKQLALQESLKLKDAKFFKKLLKSHINNNLIKEESRAFLSETLEEITVYLRNFEKLEKEPLNAFKNL